ncbi:hypothetical protein D9O29_01480 [Pantoea vagans]|uniref:SecY/secA suppressor protein n=1 Tax=Pantoea vagans TaxID=470934 RepID=A0ABY3LKR3_9GAMM|nr:hypothetical protein D9O29_01480 [Pantoea vagans]
MSQSNLAKFLNLTDEQLEDSGIDEDLIQEDTGSSGEMTYSYYFNVPEETSSEVLEEKQWEVGDRVEIPLWFFDEDEAPDDDDGWEPLPEVDHEEEKRKSDQEERQTYAEIKRKENM